MFGSGEGLVIDTCMHDRTDFEFIIMQTFRSAELYF